MIPLLGSEHQGFLFFGPVPSWATQSLQGRDVEGSRFLSLSWDLRFIGLARFVLQIGFKCAFLFLQGDTSVLMRARLVLARKRSILAFLT